MDFRFRAKVLNSDPMTNPENGYVEGFYYQDLDGGEVKHYIHNCPMTWEVDPSTVHVSFWPDLPDYKNPVTTLKHVKELQEILVQTTVDYIKKHNLTDIYAVSFGVDGLENNAIEFGCWTPTMDSSINIEGLQEEEGKKYRVRKKIGDYM